MAKIELSIKSKELILKTNLFEDLEEVDIDRILKIDHTRINQEVLTFSVILNRLGILLAEAENELRESELDLEIWMSKEKERIRNLWDNDENRPIVRGYKYTIDQVENAVESNPNYLIKRKKINRLKKNVSIVNSIYWSAKSKDSRLEKLTEIIPLDLDTIESDEFNGVQVKRRKPLIKSH